MPRGRGAPDWDWPSAATSSRPTMAASAPRAGSARARPSPSSSPLARPPKRPRNKARHRGREVSLATESEMSERVKPTYLRQHRVGDRDQLLAEWQDLFPEFHPDPSRYGQPRRFQGRDLDPQEAGWVFQHWICEAFRLCDLRVDDAYSVPLETSERIKEEIDGLVTMEWLGFLLQCKLEKDPV